MKKYHDHGGPHPHYVGCEGCRAERSCNCCGREMDRVAWGMRCTNGRCSQCHVHVCTAGGSTNPGHGAGKPEKAHEQRERMNA